MSGDPLDFEAEPDPARPAAASEPSLRDKTIHAVRWNFASTMATQLVQFVVGILIARQLLPADFGLLGMLGIFLALARALADGGFSSALIQKRDATDTDGSSVFFVNLGLSILMAAGLCGLARPVALFYGQPILESMLYALAVSPVLTAIGRVHAAWLTKRMDFRSQFYVAWWAGLASGAVGLSCAWAGCGVWSLVLFTLVNELVRNILLWWWDAWRPSWTFSWSSIREMSGFGFPLLGSQVVATVAQEIYPAAIGKLHQPADVGLFTRAKTLLHLPVGNLTTVVGAVTFPAFALAQDDLPRLRRGMRQALRLLAFCVFPLIAFITGCASTLVAVLLTERWAGCVPYMRLLCVVEVLFPLAVVNLNLIKARGRSQLYFVLTLLKQVNSLIALAITCRWGIAAIIAGQAVAALLNYGLNSYYAGKLLGYTTARQLIDLAPFLALAALVGGVCFAIDNATGLAPLWRLVLQTAIAPSLYLGLSWLCRIPELGELGRWLPWIRPASTVVG